MTKKKSLYIILLILVCTIFGFSFVIVKYLLEINFPTFLLLGLRFTIGAGFLLLIRKFIRLPKINEKEIRNGFVLGIVIFIGFALQTFGAIFTTPAKNGLFTGLYVIFVPLIIIIIKRKFSLKPILLAILSFIGVVVVSNVFVGNLSINIGDILTVLCALAFAIQFVLLEKYAPSLNPINFTIIQLLTVAGVSIILSLLTETNFYISIQWGKVLLSLIFLGVFSTGLAYYIQTVVQTKISANTVSVVSCMESVFAIIFSILLKYDVFSMSLLVGSLIIIVSMIISSISNQENLIGNESLVSG